MNRIALVVLGFLLLGSEPAFAHGGGHPTPTPLPPNWTPPPPPVPPPTTPPSTTPAPGYIVVPASSSTGAFTVYWGPLSAITGFELEEDVNPAFTNQWRYSLASSVTAVKITGRTNGYWYYRVRAVNNGVASAWCTGGNACLVNLQGTLTVSIGAASPSFIRKAPGNLADVLQVNLAADAVENITLQSLAFRASGTLDDLNDIVAVVLFVDVNGNGISDAGTDIQLGGPCLFTGNDGAVTFPALARTISAGSQESWLLVVQLSPGSVSGATFQASIRFASDVSAQGSLTGGPPIVVGPPVQGGQMTVWGTTGAPGGPGTPPPASLGSLSLGVGPANPGNRNLPGGSDKNELLHLSLEAGPGEKIRIDTLVLTFFGTMPEPSGLATFSLYADSNGNRILDGDDRLLRGPVPILPSDSNILFLALGEEIPAAQKALWFVTADVSKDVPVGSTMGVNLDKAHFVSVKGASSRSSVPVNGLPILGPEMTIVEGEAPASAGASRGGCGAVPSGEASPLGVLGLGLLFLAFLAVRRVFARSR
jgi:hypothetical protein